MKSAAASQSKSPSVVPQAVADALEQMLRAQRSGHQELLRCIERKRLAIRTADIGAITSICADENSTMQRLADIEKHRLTLIGKLTQSLQPAASKPLSVLEIAENVPDPQRTRLIALAAELRETLAELKSQSSIVRAAAETLNRHMSGIMQTVHSALGRARVYGQRGNIALGAPLHSAVDIKS